ncbi:hypothetical protein [Winogradskya humida]|uniref:Uncharacterized protein n=1 Tax=Winogradskya humida TaxID=113566 RepID=A0ABQ4A948_9ACTN|nr:hypothetical protein [Actinoplanes humidus]GIE26857.1 hypothetical protein Ahu01nite_099590 [Actinoplanes humidus]
MPRTPHSHGSSSSHGGDEGGSTPGRHTGGGSTVHPASSVNDVHQMSADALQANRPGGGGGQPQRALTARPTPKALTPGTTTMTLQEIRRARGGPSRGEVGEQYGREMYGGGPERHFPVTPNSDPDFPVTRPGGRKVDVPVDLPGGRVLAVEIKHYRDWKTVTAASGEKRATPAEVPLDAHTREEVNKDVAKRKEDPNYDPRWVFLQAGPSPQLRQHLMDAGIIFVEHG